MNLDNSAQLTHTSTIKGVQYTTVSIFSGDMDLYEKMGKMIAESFCASELSDSATENSSPMEKVG